MAEFSLLANSSNFYEYVNAKLLSTPVSRFVLARGMMGALSKSLDTSAFAGGFAGIGHTADGNPDAGSGVPAWDSASPDLGAGMLSEIFTTPLEPTFTGGPGTTVRFNRLVFPTSTYTEASREIKGDVSTTPMNVEGEQTTMTLKLFGGPYSSGQAAIAPYGVDAFSASVGVSKAREIIGENMKMDMHATFDSFVNVALQQGDFIGPAGMTTVDTVTDGGWLSYEQLSRAERAADEANCPVFGDGRRVMFVSPAGIQQLRNDPQFTRYAQYFKEFNGLFPGYINSVGNINLVLSTSLGTTSGALATVHKGLLVGPGAIGVGAGEGWQVRANNNNNYGLSAKFIWTAPAAIKLLDKRFCRVVGYSNA